jgi:hypothetical protein
MESEQRVLVRDNPDRSRFEITVDGELAGFSEYPGPAGWYSPIPRSARPTGNGGWPGGWSAPHWTPPAGASWW